VSGVRAELLRRISTVEENVSLAQFSALGTGGTADFFTVSHDAIELIEAVKGAIDAKLPYVVVGSGGGVLFADGGFPGLVIHNQSSSCVMTADHSQMIVDSGMSLQRFITTAAGQGFGGLTSLYGLGGTVGGALYSNASTSEQSILSSVRYVTLLLPPTKMKVDVSMVRYKADWLLKDGEGLTRLQRLQAERPIDEPRPVILNAHIQLTSVRSDEIIRRIAEEVKQLQRKQPKGEVWGPIFHEPAGTSVHELLAGTGIEKIRTVEGVQVDRKNRNFLRRGKVQPTASGIWQLAVEMQQQVWHRSGVELKFAFERIGVWE